MIRLSIETTGGPVLIGELKRLEANVTDLDKAGAWQAASDVISQEMEALFDKQGATDNAPQWSRLTPRTIKRRTKLRQTPIRIGWASGRMATSLIEPTASGAIEIRKKQEYIRGTAVANKGVSYPSIFEQRRPIMGRLFRGPNTRTINRLMDAMEEAVFRGLDK